MAQINLLPTDLAPRPAIVKTSGIVKHILTVGFIIFIVSAIALTAFYFIYTRDLKSSRDKVAALSASVKSLEVTEVRLLLVRDRLEKAKLVLGSESSLDELEAAGTLLSNLPQESSLSSAEFMRTDSKMTIVVPTTKVLTLVLSTLTSSGLYKNVDISSLSFTPQTGFNVQFQLIR